MSDQRFIQKKKFFFLLKKTKKIESHWWKFQRQLVVKPWRASVRIIKQSAKSNNSFQVRQFRVNICDEQKNRSSPPGTHIHTYTLEKKTWWFAWNLGMPLYWWSKNTFQLRIPDDTRGNPNFHPAELFKEKNRAQLVTPACVGLFSLREFQGFYKQKNRWKILLALWSIYKYYNSFPKITVKFKKY